MMETVRRSSPKVASLKKVFYGTEMIVTGSDSALDGSFDEKARLGN